VGGKRDRSLVTEIGTDKAKRTSYRQRSETGEIDEEVRTQQRKGKKRERHAPPLGSEGKEAPLPPT
jgi:hypothetical protein